MEHGGHTDPEWRSGHEVSAALLVPIETTPSILERLAPLRKELNTFPFVSVHPDHFLHITLFVLGFLVDEPDTDQEISAKRLEEIGLQTRQALEDFPAFDVELANLNAFPAAAFVEVYDEGMLTWLRRRICTGCGIKEPPGPPHLTLAYFEAPDGTPVPERLTRTIERYRDWPVGETRVSGIRLASLDLTSEYPKPQTLVDIPLAGAAGV